MPPVQSARTCRLVGLVPRGSQRAAGLWPWTPGHAPPMGSLRGGGARPAGAGVFGNHLVARTIFLSLDYQENPEQMPKMLDRDRVGSDGRPGRVPGRAKVVGWDIDARRSPGCRAPDVEPRMSSAVSRAGPWLSALRLSPLPVVVGAGCRTLTGMGRTPLAAGRCWAVAARDVQLPAPLAFPVLSLSGLHRRGRLLAGSAIRRMLTESSLAGRGRGCRTAGRSARGDSIRRPGARRMSTPGHAGGRAQPPG